MESVKSTINISTQLREELNKYVALKMVPSFSSGVNSALELYLKDLRRSEYERMMAAAALDKDFLKRTKECHEEMSRYESGVAGEW